ncbi:MAG: hypothetical protein CFE31_05635 [Rhizobiales bacterium PAR1]|nr:MAG: hypothetical protein CFE31_05635 [Rhizobiales bacterium PAR1]
MQNISTMTTEASARRNRKPTRPHATMPQTVLDDILLWLDHAERHLADPASPRANPNLLCALWGPFAKLEPGTDPATGKPCILLNTHTPKREDRAVPETMIAVVQLSLAYGGHLTTNDSGNGFGYLKFGPGRIGITLLRLMLNAGPDEIARQGTLPGGRKAHRSLDPRQYALTTSEGDTQGDTPKRRPVRGRQDLLAMCRETYRKYQHLSTAPKLTEEEYLSLIERALALHDAIHELGSDRGEG